MKFIRMILAIHGFLALIALADPTARQEFRMGEPELLKPQEKILKLDDDAKSRGLNATKNDKCPELTDEDHTAYVGSSEIIDGSHYYQKESVARCASHYKPKSGNAQQIRTCTLGTDGKVSWEGKALHCQAKDPTEITTCSELLESACEEESECIWVDNDKKCIFENANSCSPIPEDHIVYHNCTQEDGVVYYVDESTATCAEDYTSSGSKNTLTCQHSPATGSFSWDQNGLNCKPIGGDKCKIRRSTQSYCESDGDCIWDSTDVPDKCSYKSKLSKLTHKAALDFCYKENDETDCKAKHCDWELNKTTQEFHCTSKADKNIEGMLSMFKSFAACSTHTTDAKCPASCEWDSNVSKCKHKDCKNRTEEVCKFDCHWTSNGACENRTDEAKHIFHAAAQGVKHEAGCVQFAGKKDRCEVENNCHYWVGICYYKAGRN